MEKRYLNDYKFNSVFVRTFTIIFLSSIIPILAANTIIYKLSTETIQEKVWTNNLNMLSKTNKAVDLLYNQIDQTLIQLSKDTDVLSFMMNPDETLAARNKKILGNLQNIHYTNSFISSIYIYSKFNNRILCPDIGIVNLDNFSDRDWFDSYNRFFTGTYRMETRTISNVFDNKQNCITFIRSLPYGSWSKSGAVVINVNEENLYNIMFGLDKDEPDSGSVYAINNNGTIISHKDKSKLFTDIHDLPYIKKILGNEKGYFIENVEGKQMLFTYITSNYDGWKFIHEIPLSYIQKDSEIVSRLIIITMLICLLISMVFSFLISRGIYFPIEKLMNLIPTSSRDKLEKQNKKAKNEFEFLGNVYNDVINENENINNRLNNLKPLIKEKLFTNLVAGVNESQEEAEERLKFLNIEFPAKSFVVMAIQVDDYNSFKTKYSEGERNLYRLQLANFVEDLILGRFSGVCVEVEANKFAAVINCNDGGNLIEGRADYYLFGEEIKSQVEKQFPFTITLGIGKMYEGLMNIQFSYKEAVNALEYKLYQGKNEVISIDDILMHEEGLFYSDPENEKMLLNNIRIGEKGQVAVHIQRLFKEIMDNRNNSISQVQQIFIRLLNQIIEIVINQGISLEEIFGPDYNLYEELKGKETIRDIETWFLNNCNKFVEAINSVNQKKGRKNVEKILEYINEHINDDISLNEISDWIGFSPAYVSKMIKEFTGKNYIDYLNGSRIEKAKQLLQNTQLSIKETGFKVGFNSIQTFMRTFKKYEGITPGQYRDKF